MSGGPSKKKLKQCTISEVFQRQTPSCTKSVSTSRKGNDLSSHSGRDMSLTADTKLGADRGAVRSTGPPNSIDSSISAKDHSQLQVSSITGQSVKMTTATSVEHAADMSDVLRGYIDNESQNEALDYLLKRSSDEPSSICASKASQPSSSKDVNLVGVCETENISKDIKYGEYDSPFDTSLPLFDSDSEATLEDDAAPMQVFSTHATYIPSLQSEAGGSEPSQTTWRGIPHRDLLTTPACSLPLPPLPSLKSDNHTVLFRLPVVAGRIPTPYPAQYVDRWDNGHVRLPCSPESLYPVHGEWGRKELRSRWSLIRESLTSPMTSSYQLQEAILSYNSRYADKWSFAGLHDYFAQVLDAREATAFFAETLPKMVDLALRLPQLCTAGIPLLRASTSPPSPRGVTTSQRAVTMTQEQCACLLANAWFCTFPRRNARGRQSEYAAFPDINFQNLFSGEGAYCRKVEKLQCLLHYFRHVTQRMPTGAVTFLRQRVTSPPTWENSDCALTALHVATTGTIEDDGHGLLQVDFANAFVGGGVLGQGAVQEEIRFLICPELILSRLITERLESDETLLITGAERFSNYTGYADSFCWAGPHEDVTLRDAWGRRVTCVVAMDALRVRNYAGQFAAPAVRRELNKAYCGFAAPPAAGMGRAAVATGNWGCGVFGGDVQLKALLQLLAAAQAGRDLCYFTFGDTALMDEIHGVHTLLRTRGLRVADVMTLIARYRGALCERQALGQGLYAFIRGAFSQGQDTDDDEGAHDGGRRAEATHIIENDQENGRGEGAGEGIPGTSCDAEGEGHLKCGTSDMDDSGKTSTATVLTKSSARKERCEVEPENADSGNHSQEEIEMEIRQDNIAESETKASKIEQKADLKLMNTDCDSETDAR